MCWATLSGEDVSEASKSQRRANKKKCRSLTCDSHNKADGAIPPTRRRPGSPPRAPPPWHLTSTAVCRVPTGSTAALTPPGRRPNFADITPHQAGKYKATLERFFLFRLELLRPSCRLLPYDEFLQCDGKVRPATQGLVASGGDLKFVKHLLLALKGSKIWAST